MNSFMSEGQFNPQLQSGNFQPVDIVDIAPALEAEQRRRQQEDKDQLNNLRQYNRDMLADTSSRQDEDLKSLSKFSNTLSELLVEEQKAANERAQQRGAMMYYMDGVTPEEAAEFEITEAGLDATKQVAEGAAAEFEDQGGDMFTSEKIRRLSGWEAYGFHKARLQTAASTFGSYIMQNADKTTVNIGGRPVTLENANEPEEAAAVMQAMVSEYVQDYAGMNPVMLDKYLFKEMRAITRQQLAIWSQQRQAELKKEREEEQRGTIYTAVTGPNSAVNLNNIIDTFPRGQKAGKLFVAETLIKQIQNGTITDDQLEQVEAAVTDEAISFRGEPGKLNSLVGNDSRIFNRVLRAITTAKTGRLQRQNAEDELRKKAFYNAVEKKIQSGNFTDEDRNNFILEHKRLFPFAPISSVMSGLLTTDELERENQRRELQARAEAQGGRLMPQDVIGFDVEVLEEFKEELGAAEVVSNATKQTEKDKKTFLNGFMRELSLFSEGTTNPVSDEAAIQAIQVERRFDELFENNALKMTPQEAFNTTVDQIKAEINTNNIQNYNRFPTVNSDVVDRRRRTQELLGKYKDMAIMQRMPTVTDTELEDAMKYLQTGRGTLPFIFKHIADRYPELSAVEIAGRQLELSEYKGYKIPKIEQRISQSNNLEAVRLVRHKPSPSRTYRAFIQDPDLVDFFDVVADKESEGSGGYEAYNLEGINNGNTPIGSGDSSDGKAFGKPLTQMTVGEIMSLHNREAIHAVGRYQFVKDPFRETVQGLGLSRDTVFSPQVQDAMALYRLRWRLNLPGQNNIYGLMNEWVGLNKLSKAQLQELLEDARDVFDPYNAPELLLKGLN